jgi:hypothetical protein
LILALAGTALCAWLLGGPAGAGVLAGGVGGLGLGVLVALLERRLFAARDAFGGLLFGFLSKLTALLAAAVLFLALEPQGVDPAAFVLALLAGVLLASAGARLGARSDERPGARAEAGAR